MKINLRAAATILLLSALLFFPSRAAGTAPTTADMALIPAGAFVMGDALHEGNPNESPTHEVYVSAFMMDRGFVTKAQWDIVYPWALAHGYQFDSKGAGKATNHPVQMVNWYDIVKWCNARSEKEGLTPCYFTSADRKTLYRSGQLDLDNASVDWTASGYRLPTEAEWEKAARGGAAGHRFPWTDVETISQERANYYASSNYPYDLSSARGYHPALRGAVYPFTNPVDRFAPNGYGLHDMAGNLWQWCWDWYDVRWYSQPGATGKDPHGPTASPVAYGFRVMRGGSWHRSANFARCAHRGMDAPDLGWITFGFRCVKRA